MRPEADQILNVSADQLLAAAMDGIGDAYGKGTAAIHALLMKFIAREYERGAEIRAAENREIRAVFGELASQVSDAALRARLQSAASLPDGSLAISALNAASVELRQLLIAMHSHIEASGPREAEQRIWTVLRAMATRRAVSLF